MAMYWTCQYGANHDFGEQCDCREEMEKENSRRINSGLLSMGEAGQMEFVF